ncbi:hypothetical protein EDD18DRAFT_872818 [Armillaria luteobubalina]|uniref:Uncharacterized protein n=1 Tax=Armillaria luteobubalina TaxID=153913 RepID=A0AA39U6P3_9AGAR|nr:hypothetical protein EDD18DRAFT_872818 [Armillaria luteobubalina]
MPISPRKTRSTTSALRNRTTPAPAARPAKKGRVVSTPNAKIDISPVQRLHNLLTDALTTAKTLELTPDSCVALQNVREIAVSLLDILPGERAVRDLKYDLHYISLTSLSRELTNVEEYDPDDEHDEQAPLMKSIMEEVVEWLPDIWLAMAEENADLVLIRTCLNLASSAANDLGEEFDCTDRLIIINSEKKTVYNQSYYVVDYVAWMWREFLVFSALRGYTVSAGEVTKDDDLYEQIFSLFRQATGGPGNEDGCAFWDEHWTQEMRNISSSLYAERHSHRITEFIKHPSFHQYTSLVSEYRDIEPCILSSMRERVFSDKPFIRCWDAAEIFAAASQTEDIVRLLDRLTEKVSILHTRAIIIIVRYLSKTSDKKHRTRALQVVENGLKMSKRGTLDAVDQLFPGLADAQLWLRHLRDAGDFPFDDDILHDKYHERDENLRSFAERAVVGGPLTDPNWAPPVKKPETQRDVYGCCLEEEPDLSEHDLAGFIQDWARVLGEWPDEAAATKVWSRLKLDGSELVFSAVEGGEEALLDRLEHADLVQQDKWRKANPLPPPTPRPRCQPRFTRFPAPCFRSYDYSQSPSCVYGYVTDGLRALIKTFSCQDHRNLCK